MRQLGRWLLVALLIALGASEAAGTSHPLLLDIQQPPLAWCDSRLSAKVQAALSHNSELRVCLTDALPSAMPPFPNARTDIDSLMNWGIEGGGRFLLVVTVDREDFTTRKTFSLPLVFHRYEMVGIISGEYCLLDLQKGRLLVSEPFETKLKGPRQLQSSAEDNRNDPGLHLTAPEKTEFFGKLEDKFTAELTAKVREFVRGR
jgi:hypothetical protein